MKLLVTGRGSKSGSWEIRANQLGRAIGAQVEMNASYFRGYDAVIIVKRWRPHIVAGVHDAGTPLIWDVVDSYSQLANDWGRDECMQWLRGEVAAVKPNAIVAATHEMAKDCAEFGVPVLALPHHARPGLRRNPIRDVVRVVGYEGRKEYLGHWDKVLERLCTARGWSWTINPTELASLDIVVAQRKATGYAQRMWKSNVKLANAQGSGTPCIMNRERGYIETGNGSERWADNEAEMSTALDSLAPVEVRRTVAEKLFEARLTLDYIATRYKEWLRTLL